MSTDTAHRPAPVIPWAGRSATLLGSVIDASTALLQKQPHDVVSFAMGSPAAEAIPSDLFAELYEHVLARSRFRAFDYGATEGEPRLRAALLDYLQPTGERTTAERLLITSGGMQGLDLTAKLFIDPGDLVFVEAPTYTNGTATLLAYGAELVEVPVDEDGMVVESLPELARQAGRRPKAIYVIPDFQNPSSASLSLARRHLLLQLAREWNAIIIDDNPYGTLRFHGAVLPGFREIGEGDPLVVSVRTFSKILAPGLRVGWIDADPAIVSQMVNAKQTMDTCTNVPNQLLVAEFLARGRLEPHLQRLRVEYLTRMRAMDGALERNLGGRASWTKPAGGFFLWLTFGADVDTDTLFGLAVSHGVAFIPGRAFSVAGEFGNSLRLCFASQNQARTDIGVQRLAEALRTGRSGDPARKAGKGRYR